MPGSVYQPQPRRKRSPIWCLPREQFAELVAASQTLSDILRHFGMEYKGGNHRTLKARLEADSINFAHIDLRRGVNLRRYVQAQQVALDVVLVQESRYPRGKLKRRLLASGMLKEECAVCGQGPIWRERPLVLVLDHIDGVSDDHRLENLRMLCPNCNSQTEAFSGPNYIEH